MKTLWVNAYEMVHKVGGREEGGWYYWEGLPMWSQPSLCACDVQHWGLATAHLEHCPVKHLHAEAQDFIDGFTDTGYLPDFINKDGEEPERRGESIERKYAIRIEESVGKFFPDVPPIYE